MRHLSAFLSACVSLLFACVPVLAAAASAVPASPAAAPAFIATSPAPRVEYWQRRYSEIDERLQAGHLEDIRVVFLGDSITDFWTLGANPWVDGQTGGLAVWNQHFGGQVPALRAMNFGVSGDRTEHVLFRLQSKSASGLGQFDAPALKPDVVVLMIGINNSWAAELPAADSIFAGIQAVVSAVRAHQPQARIVLESLLPTNDAAKNRATVLPVNQRLRAMSATAPFAGHVDYLDLYPRFIDAEGRQLGNLFMDGLHPNEAGYRVWAEALLPALAKP